MNVFFKRTWKYPKAILTKVIDIGPSKRELALADDWQTNDEAEKIKEKKEIVANVVSHFPDNYEIDQSLLDEIYSIDDYRSELNELYRVLSKSKKVDCPRVPLEPKEKYSYFVWMITPDRDIDIPTMLSTHPRLFEINEKTEELSAAKADILILGSGRDNITVNKLLSKIDLAKKYVIICSSFGKQRMNNLILYRMDKNIYPYELWNEKICHTFIDEVIAEAGSNA